MYQIVCRLGLRHRPHWGSLKRSPRPPSWIKGPTSIREGRGGEGTGGEGREGREGAATSTFAPGGTNARAASAF